jgi:hypothetical protein
MADQIPQFETEDVLGTSDSYEGTVGVSLTAVPSSAGTIIQSFFVICDPDQDFDNELYVYLDGGTLKAATMYPGGCFGGDIRGSKTQIHIKANVANVKYQITLNREPN